jgi:hypothetical protein
VDFYSPIRSQMTKVSLQVRALAANEGEKLFRKRNSSLMPAARPDAAGPARSVSDTSRPRGGNVGSLEPKLSDRQLFGLNFSNKDHIVGGGQLEINLQIRNFVLGVEVINLLRGSARSS